MTKPSLSVLAILLLAGCATVGTKVTEEQANQFVKGKSTEAEVIAKLGAPNSTTHLSDGTHTDIYVYSATQIRATSFIPVVNLMAGGAGSKTTMVIFKFAPTGILTDWTSTSGGTAINEGLMNQ